MNEISLSKLIVKSGLARTQFYASCLIKAGAVRVNGDKITDPVLLIAEHPGMVLKVGRETKTL